MNKKILYIFIILTLVFLLTGCTVDDPGYIIVQSGSITQTDDSAVIVKAKIDGEYEPLISDASSHALVTITSDHHRIHEGKMYTVSDTVAADTTVAKWMVETANTDKYCHLVFSLYCTGEATYLVTEGADRDKGTDLYEINRRRVGTVDIAETVVTRTPIGGTTDGNIVLFSVRTGSTGIAGKTIEGGAARAENEFVLRPNTKYIISITTYADVYATCKLDWYEVKDLN